MTKSKASLASSSFFALILSVSLASLATGCAGSVETPDPQGNEEEVITAVELTFTPSAGGSSFIAMWEDPENDGSPVIDDIVLADGEVYTLDVRFLNQLEDPAEDISEEVADEADEHQVLIFGSAVNGPGSDAAAAIVTHAYDDEDSEQLPIGLTNTLTATGLGAGVLSVMLRHLPPEDGSAVKTDAIAGDFAEGGTNAIGGGVDANVDFAITVE